MKKTFLAIALITAALFITCGDSPDDSGNIEPLPKGVYIAGRTSDNLACYWTGGKRVILDVSGYRNATSDIQSISASGGKVLVDGDVLTPLGNESWKGHPCYWVDNKRFEKDKHSTLATISDGKVYVVKESDYKDFALSSIAVYGGKVYAAGIYDKNPDFYASYFVGNIRHDIVHCNISFDDNIPDHLYYSIIHLPVFITVSEDGTVYVAGKSGNTSAAENWYYSNGEIFALQEANAYINRIMIYEGKVYVFGISYKNRIYYWVDGEKVTLELPENSIVRDAAMFDGKPWMVGYDEQGACYWTDGERHGLSGAWATAIFVEE